MFFYLMKTDIYFGTQWKIVTQTVFVLTLDIFVGTGNIWLRTKVIAILQIYCKSVELAEYEKLQDLHIFLLYYCMFILL